MFNNEKVTKEDYYSIQRAIFENMALDMDGSKLFDADYFNQTCSIEFSRNGKPKRLKYEPEKYSKAKKTEKFINRSDIKTYSEQLDDDYKSYGDLYMDHLAGDITASWSLGIDSIYEDSPDYKDENYY